MAQRSDDRARLGGAGRRARGPDPRAVGRRQVAAGARPDRSGAWRGLLRFARLVGDDRVHLEAAHGRLLVRPAEALAGLIEVRGLGHPAAPHEPSAVVGLVVDLAAADAERLPEPTGNTPISPGSNCRDLPSQRARRPCRWCWRSSLRADPRRAFGARNLSSGHLRPPGDGSGWRLVTITPLDSAGASPLGIPSRFDFRLPQCNKRRKSARKPLALGLWMVKMSTLSCGATGTRPRGVP